jgi:hypothetical protein
LRRDVEPGTPEVRLYSKMKIGYAYPFPLPLDYKCGKIRNWFQVHSSPYCALEINVIPYLPRKSLSASSLGSPAASIASEAPPMS